MFGTWSDASDKFVGVRVRLFAYSAEKGPRDVSFERATSLNGTDQKSTLLPPLSCSAETASSV